MADKKPTNSKGRTDAPEAGEAQAGGKKLTRAERSALNKKLHAEKLAKEQAAEAPDAEALKNLARKPKPKAGTAKPKTPRKPKKADENTNSAPSDDTRTQGARTHAHAHESGGAETTGEEPENPENAGPGGDAGGGEDDGPVYPVSGYVLDDAEWAGLTDIPVPPETPATSRYVGAPHEWNETTEGNVVALRFGGQNDEEIALYIGISIATLYRHYHAALAEAQARASGEVILAISTMALRDFKAMRFVAEKRLRGFGNAEKPFVAVRPNASEQVIRDITNGRTKTGQSPEAMAMRKQKSPEPGPDGVVDIGMTLGVAERPLKTRDDGTVEERTDDEIAADVAERGDA